MKSLGVGKFIRSENTIIENRSYKTYYSKVSYSRSQNKFQINDFKESIKNLLLEKADFDFQLTLYLEDQTNHLKRNQFFNTTKHYRLVTQME